MLIGLTIVATGLFWNMSDDIPPAEPTTLVNATASHALATPQPTRLMVGMSEDEVLALQGEPTSRTGTTWEYGPSWVRFEDSRLKELHSSPLYPLKTH